MQWINVSHYLESVTVIHTGKTKEVKIGSYQQAWTMDSTLIMISISLLINYDDDQPIISPELAYAEVVGILLQSGSIKYKLN